MYYYPSYYYPSNSYNTSYTDEIIDSDRLKGDMSYLRVFHAVPDAPPIDVYINDKKIVGNLRFKQFSEYLPIPRGTYSLKVFQAGTMSLPIISKKLIIDGNEIATIAAINMTKDVALMSINEPMLKIKPANTNLRFIHLSPNSPHVDVVLPSGGMLFQDIGYAETTDYIPVAPATYTVQVKPTGSNKVVLTVPNITLKPERYYTIYAIGLLDGKPPLQVVIPLDGNSYLK